MVRVKDKGLRIRMGEAVIRDGLFNPEDVSNLAIDFEEVITYYWGIRNGTQYMRKGSITIGADGNITARKFSLKNI